ncbi:PREDICTED: survival of motor neuron-related-splicing factor 30-like, partial [Rhagoletis zephyria]|uniref:survival of motor neuron-related-splicing factor 30-like n=1 Tax=Rhagoletis zephyria TaxID=28612 RepID=UPI00081130C3
MSSADNIANVRNYQIQLQQVETALAAEPDNEEMKILKKDLEEVIALTMSVMEPDELAMLKNSTFNSHLVAGSSASNHNYKAGDYVLAPWSEDGQFYEAQIEDITSDGQCTVVFSNQKRRLAEVCLVSLLKPVAGKNRRYGGGGGGGSSTSKDDGEGGGGMNSMKNFKVAQEVREAQKRKQQKRKEKLKALEEEREKDKAKWQSFASKVIGGGGKKGSGKSSSSSSFSALKKKSIFATPESVTGRVGVGTCGVGGKPMTEYQMKMEKVKKTATTLPKFSLADGDRDGDDDDYD